MIKKAFFIATMLTVMTAAWSLCQEVIPVKWQIYEDPYVYKTDNEEWKISRHGDPILFRYEPSGTQGLMIGDGSDKEALWGQLVDFILGNITENFNQDEFFIDYDTDLSTFNEATYTYALTRFKLPGEFEGTVYLNVGRVDDGLAILCNRHIIGYRDLGEHSTKHDLNVDIDGKAGVLSEGINTLVLILVDDSRDWKIIKDVYLYASDFTQPIGYSWTISQPEVFVIH